MTRARFPWTCSVTAAPMAEALAAQGRSSTKLELLGDTVRKTAPDGPTADRLAAQYKKQMQWPQFGRTFVTVPVQAAQLTGGGFAFSMPYCGGLGAPQWVAQASVAELRQLGDDLTQLIDAMVQASEMRPLDRSTLDVKINHVLRNANGAGWQPDHRGHAVAVRVAGLLTQRIGYKVGRESVPYGTCHGDLTLANVLFTRDADGRQRYWLFDHLNVFMESPLLDMAKLRQETRLYWASRTSTQPHDRLRYALAMHWLDRYLVRRWRSAYPWWRTWASVFEAVNLLRLLPYIEPDTPLADAVVDELEAYAR